MKQNRTKGRNRQFYNNSSVSSVQSLSRVRLCDPMNCSTPGLPVHHQLRVHSDSRPSSQWCHPAISFSVVPFSSCPQSLPASESFPISQLFAFNTLLTIIWNQSEGCKEKGFNTLSHLNLTDIHRTLYPTTTEYTFLLSCI